MDMLLTAGVIEVVLFAPVGFIHGCMAGFLFMLLRFCEVQKRSEISALESFGGAYRGYQEIERKNSDDDQPLMSTNQQTPYNNFPHVLLSDSDEEQFTMNI